ncbi:hypothetical protein LBMAG53_28890 [Planctomycetota bacterium]|nr:hypothetical protein LBMAG53_28890 [Planctomycetota bacterium]
MLRHLLFSCVFLIHAASAADGPIKHPIMVAEYGASPNRLIELDADGKLVWEHKPPSTMVCFQVLASGNVLYGFGGKPTGMREVTRKGDEVWRYTSTCGQLFCGTRLANGNTLIAEQGPCQAVEVDAHGKLVLTTPLTTSYKSVHQQVRNVQKLENGNILAAHEGEGAVREVDPAGKVVWELTGVPMVGHAIRQANGNTLIAGATQKRVFEVSPDKQVVWEFGAADAPDLNLTWVSGLQPLKNGNLVVTNFLRGSTGKGAHAFEVTRDKKVVWQWADHALCKAVTNVRVLDD